MGNQFIELTSFLSGDKILVNRNQIVTISYDARNQYSDRLVISFGNGEDDYIWVKESYEEVKGLLNGQSR